MEGIVWARDNFRLLDFLQRLGVHPGYREQGRNSMKVVSY